MRHQPSFCRIPVRPLSGVCLLIFFAFLALGFLPAVAAQSDAYSERGPYAVGTLDSLTLPAAQGRDVVVRVRFPEGDGPFPVIVFSHGLGANKDAFGEVTAHWASHGYVVIHPSHDDRGVGLTGGGMHPSEEKVRERHGDVIAAFDALDRIGAAIPALQGKLDPTRMGVAGHSYGSFVALVTAGATIDIGDETNAGLGDPRVRCIAPISPSGRGDYGFNDRSFAALSLPMMVFTGTRDQRNGRPEDWRMEPYRLSPAGDKYLIVITDASHGQFGGEDASSDAPLYVKTATVAFWDSCLRGADAGKSYLDAGGFEAFAGDRATFETR